MKNYLTEGNILLSNGDPKKAVYSYRKALNVKPNDPEVFNNLGIALMQLEKFEEAILNFDKAIRFKADNLKSINNLIYLLTFYYPKNKDLNSIIFANHLLRSVKYNYNPKKQISDEDIANLFNSCISIIYKYKINIKYNNSQLYRRNEIRLNCARHLRIFNIFSIIPEYCFGCYKILIEPRNILELFKLSIIFDNLNLKNNLNKKCMIELRSNVKGTYKGYIYCGSLDEANKVYGILVQILNKQINKLIPISIKRGCSEYYDIYPEYKKISQNPDQLMNYNKDWRKKEKIYDTNLKKNNTLIVNIFKNSLSGISLTDILIMQHWLVFAKKIGDKSYKKIYKDELSSEFIEKELSLQLLTRKNEFSPTLK